MSKGRAYRISRDSVLFLAGLSGLFHETVITEGERPFLLAVFASLCGLPWFLRVDERLHGTPAKKEVGRALLEAAIQEELAKYRSEKSPTPPDDTS